MDRELTDGLTSASIAVAGSMASVQGQARYSTRMGASMMAASRTILRMVLAFSNLQTGALTLAAGKMTLKMEEVLSLGLMG